MGAKKRKNSKLNVREALLAPKYIFPTIAKAYLIIIVAGFLAYSNSFQTPFIFDDIIHIPGNPTIRNLSDIKTVFLPPAGSGIATRPFVNFTLAVNYAISGEKTWSYHVINLMIHLMAAFTLFGIVRRILLSARLREKYGQVATIMALGSSLLWMLHPVQTQAVTYIIQRCESLMGLFFLLTFYFAARGWQSSFARPWHLAAILAFLFGAASKEVIIVVPVLLLACELIFFHSSIKEAFHSSWLLYGGLCLGALALVLLAVAGGAAGYMSQNPFTPQQYWQTQPQIILHYIRLAIWPYPLCFDYGWPAAELPEVLPYIALLVLMVAGTVGLLMKNPPWGFLALWFFIILAPTSIIPLLNPAEEYRIYLPLAALMPAVVILLYELGIKLQGGLQPSAGDRLPIFFCTTILLLSLLMGTLTYIRNQVYRQELTLWEDTVQKQPLNSKAQLNLGMALFNTGKLDASLIHFQEALHLKPDYPEAYSNMGGALLKMQRRQDALVYFQKGLNMHPDVKMAAWLHSNMGVALFELGREREAVDHFRQAIRLKPDQAEYYANLGFALERMNQLPEAAEAWGSALKIKPDLNGVPERLTTIKHRQGTGL